MIKQKQTILHDPAQGQIGNCFSTCIACLLNLSPDHVPNFCENDHWREDTNVFLRDHFMFYQDIILPGDMRDDIVSDWGFHVMSGKTVRGTRHSIIGLKGERYWDVHPSNDGLIEVMEYGFLIPKLFDGVYIYGRSECE